MKEEDKTKVELIKELKTLRKKREKSAVNNITKRKQAGGKLSETKEYLENLIRYANAPIIVWDTSLSITRFNRAFENLSGYHENEVIGKKIDILFSKDKIESALENIQKTVSGERWESVEIEIQRKDGESRIVLWNSANILDTKKKNVIATIAQGQDITEHKQAEEKLQDSEEYLKILFDYAPDAYYISDLKGNFIDCNKEAERLTGYKREELFGKNFLQLRLLALTDIPKLGKLFDKNLKGLPTGPDEFVLNNKDDIRVEVEISSYTVKIKGSTLALGIVRDITERKKAEEEIRLHAAMMGNVAEGVYLVGLDDLLIKWTNEKFARMFGYDPGEIVGKQVDILNAPTKKKTSTETRISIVDVLRETGEWHGEVRNIKRDGTHFWCYANVSLFDHPEYGKVIVSVHTDITERKQAEERIKHLNLVLHAIRKVNQLIVKEKNRERLIKSACNSLTKTRGYYSSYIVLMDQEGKIDTYAEAGLGEDFLPMLTRLKKGELTPFGKIALKQKKVIIIEDPASTCSDCPLVQACSSRGSVMTIRLECDEKIYGVMSVSIPAHFIADKEEQALFTEVAGDIALGLNSIEMGQKLNKQTHDLKEKVRELKRAMDATIETMSKIVEVKDPYTAGHQQRVSQLATAIAKELNFSKDKVEGIRITSLIHDIGKIGLPTEILSKPTKLSDIEFSLIKEHSQIGCDILKSIDFPYPVAKLVLQHHERLNGSGYPNHLKSDKILLEARIIGVADVVEAMASHRPYRPALGIDKALEEITQNKGVLYDPEVVDVCLKLFKEKGFKFE